MKPGSKDIQLKILITGDALFELKRHTHHMAESFGLDRRIENYQGKRSIGLYSWDFDCLLSVIKCVLEDKKDYPDKNASGYKALTSLYLRLKEENRKFDKQ